MLMTPDRTRSGLFFLCLSLPVCALATPPDWSVESANGMSAQERLDVALEHSQEGAFQEAKEWLEAAADAGSGEAKIHLGYFYQHGRGVEADGETAIQWLERGVKAGESGFAIRLAWDYLEGDLVAPDRERAEYWFEYAIEYGREDARLGLGSILLTDVVGGEQERAAEAEEHFQLALDAGLVLGSYYLARMYREGLGVERDMDRAVHYLRKGARSGDPQISGVMQAWLADAYQLGHGVDGPDPETAAGWAYRASDNGNPDGDTVLESLEQELDDEALDAARQQARQE